MSSNPSGIINVKSANKISLRSQMESLLGDFYNAIGVAPGRFPVANATDLLTDDFEARFFMCASWELMSFNKSQMLSARIGLADVRPTSRLLSLNVTNATEENVCVSYCASLRYGQSAIFHRGTLNAIKQDGRWVIRSIEEDVRVKVMPQSRINRSSDRPRVWIL